MSDDKIAQGDEQFKALCKSLGENIGAALSVGGPQRDDGRAGGLRNIDIFRQTGIARSTLQTLRPKDGNHVPNNPDLRTLNRLANLLGVPVAFLLMTPEDWEMLIKAVGDIQSIGRAAREILGSQFGTHTTVRQVLDREGLLKIPRPSSTASNPHEQAQRDEINENRRRASHVMGALMLRQPEHQARHAQHVALVGLAASITNQIKQLNKGILP
ncbi:hypothetical protein [Castellaniella caeni]|uniref:hypothetical protein n=1 Tax=Castellaniella caeni TaxID=266123 RepID=UPI0011AF2CA4|nr:hypothetical protein [Castellaniella caeni]